MIKPDMLITTIDGPFYAPNKKRIVRTMCKSDLPGAWMCRDLHTGEELTIQESKPLQSLAQMKAEQRAKPEDAKDRKESA